jgi:alpha-ketoglutarate-dependent taurine dioxygenase
MIELRPPDDGFGVVEVRGVDPLAPGAAAAELGPALARHAVVVLRFDRKLEDDELQAVASLFGPIKDPVAPTKDGTPLRYSERRQVIDAGFVMTDEVREKLGDVAFGGLDDDRPGLFETYHTDDTYTAAPARVTVLHARALPPSGGGPTHFLDVRAAWASLPASRRDEIADLRVRYAHNNGGAFPPRRAASGPADALEEVIHPLVRTHPVAGTRALWLDLDRATHVEGWPIDEGRALLQSLQDHVEKNAPHGEHAWRDHDVLVWDNASVQHKAGGNFAKGEPRRFWRYMVAAERPV